MQQRTWIRGWRSRAGCAVLLLCSLALTSPTGAAWGKEGPPTGFSSPVAFPIREAPAATRPDLVAGIARNRDLTEIRGTQGTPAPPQTESAPPQTGSVPPQTGSVPPQTGSVPPPAADRASSASEAPGAPAPAKPSVVVGGAGDVELSFDGADVNVVIATIAELIGIPYVVDPGVQGAVTIRTGRGIPKKDLLAVLHLILEVNGLTAVKEGEFYRITTGQDASRLPIQLRLRGEGEAGPEHNEVVTQILPLRYVTAAEMSKLLAPFLSANATVVSHEASNTLLVVDTATNIDKALKLVEAFDTSFLENINHRFFFLKNADPGETVGYLREVFAPAKDRAEGLRLIPIPRLSAFLALGPDDRVFAKIEQLLLSLDAAAESADPRLHVYFVRNGTAQNLAGLLEQVFSRSMKAGGGTEIPATVGGSRAALPNPLLRGSARQAGASAAPMAEPARAADREGAGGTEKKVLLAGEIRITPDEIRNALIIEATPGDNRVIMGILDSIDVLPRQVLIEATVAEIDYHIISQLGLSWEFLKGGDFAKGLVGLTSRGSTGLTVAIGLDSNLRAALDALEQENKVNIINSPHVLASDNQEARIDVSQEIPVVSAETIVPTSGESIVTTTVQYRDTGVLLRVTPHINDRKLVSLDIYQEVSEQAESVEVDGKLFPSFFKRVVETRLTVEHGQTIVLGGLIRENKGKSNSGVPCLVRLPLLGPIFGQRRNSLDKTELIILLTPKVIVDRDEIDAVTNEFKSRVESVVEGMAKTRAVPFSPLLDDVVNPER